MREKQKQLKVHNVTVLDGTVEDIPFPDDSFDIVMSGCVFGDDYDREYSQMYRVVKSGGIIIDCSGEESQKLKKPDESLLRLGFETVYYVSKSGGDVYNYRKRIVK